MDVKVRYANHYGLKGAFVWEVDTDNFMGMYGKPRYTILAAIRDAIVGGQGLEDHEILGAANDNADCSPQAPMCEGYICPDGVCPKACTVDSDCNSLDDVICKPDHSNCFYCDAGTCTPGTTRINTLPNVIQKPGLYLSQL